MRRNVRRLNREVNACLKQPSSQQQQQQQQQQPKKGPTLAGKGRNKRRKAASLTELKRFYDAAVDAASEVLSNTAASATIEGEANGTVISKKGESSAGTDGHGHNYSGMAIPGASCSVDEPPAPPLFSLSAGGGASKNTGVGQRTDYAGCTSDGAISIRPEGSTRGRDDNEGGGDFSDRCHSSPALLVRCCDSAGKGWHRRTAEGTEKRLVADSRGDAFREALRKKLEATGGTRCKLGSSKRLKTHGAGTAAGDVPGASYHREGGGGGEGKSHPGVSTMARQGVASGGSTVKNASGGGASSPGEFSVRHGDKTAEKVGSSGKRMINGERKLVKRPSSSGGNNSSRTSALAPSGTHSSATSYPTSPESSSHVDPPAGAVALCVPAPSRRRTWCATPSLNMGLSPALLEALEEAEIQQQRQIAAAPAAALAAHGRPSKVKVAAPLLSPPPPPPPPPAGVVVKDIPSCLKAPFSEPGSHGGLKYQHAGTADENSSDTGTGVWRRDAANWSSLKAPFSESGLVKPAELLLRVGGKGKHAKRGACVPRGGSGGASTTTEAVTRAETCINGNNDACLSDEGAPLIPHWRRRQDPRLPTFNDRAPPLLSSCSSSSSSSSSSCFSDTGRTSGGNIASRVSRRVTFAPCTRAPTTSLESARVPVATANKRAAAAAAAAVAAAAARGLASDGHGYGKEEEGPFTGVRVRFGIMQQRQFHRFAGHGGTGPVVLSPPS